jgi:hypothetical protein
MKAAPSPFTTYAKMYGRIPTIGHSGQLQDGVLNIIMDMAPKIKLNSTKTICIKAGMILL